MMRRLLLVGAVPRPERNYYKRYSWPVEFVVARAQGSRLERLLGERRADAAPEHGAAALRAAGRQRLGSRPRLVLERRHAGADEFRGAAGDEPEVQPARSARGRQRRRPRRCVSFVARPADAARSSRPRRTTRCSTTRAPESPGPAPTTSSRRRPRASCISSSVRAITSWCNQIAGSRFRGRGSVSSEGP